MHRRRAAGVLLVALTVGLTTQPAAAASGYSSDKTKPDLSAALAAFNYRWRASGTSGRFSAKPVTLSAARTVWCGSAKCIVPTPASATIAAVAGP